MPLPWAAPLGAALRAAVAHQKGDDDLCHRELETAIREFDRAEMGLHAATARLRLGRLRGGDQGAQMVAEAETWLANQKVKNPLRMAAWVTVSPPSRWPATRS